MLAVIPFKPFPPEVKHHRLMADFDWMAAIGMLAASLKRACRCPVRVLTDLDTALPWPAQVFRYATSEGRLMLWNLEIAACFLRSEQFDRDTVMFDADQLVYGDLAPWFRKGHDIGILVRTPPPSQRALPIINGVQFWAHRAQPRLAAFYSRALAVARALPNDDLKWGADTQALRALLEPIGPGVVDRCGLRVEMIESREISRLISPHQIAALARGRWPPVKAPVLDFRRFRKVHMRAAFDVTIARQCR